MNEKEGFAARSAGGACGNKGGEYRKRPGTCQPQMRKKVDDWLDLLLPRRCALCNVRLCAAALCPGCRADLPWLDRGEGPQGTGRPRVIAALAYEYPVDRLITALKFRRALHYAPALAEVLAAVVAGACAAEARPDLVVPVPLHRRRLVERGYNQALEIARPLARTLGLPLAAGLCRRVRATAGQTGLSAAARRRNLRGAFTATGCAGATVAVVDDVVTTGSTAAAMAAALRGAGARRVEIWAVARTL